MLTWASSSTLPLRFVVGVAQLFLDGGQVAEHAVEGQGQVFEFVACVDLGAEGGVAAADFVADIAQVGQRFDDHVAHDEIDGEPREEDRHDGVGHQDGAVVGLRLLHAVFGQNDFHHGDQVAGLDPGLARDRIMAADARFLGPNGLKVLIIEIAAMFVPLCFGIGIGFEFGVIQFIERGRLEFVERLLFARGWEE